MNLFKLSFYSILSTFFLLLVSSTLGVGAVKLTNFLQYIFLDISFSYNQSPKISPPSPSTPYNDFSSYLLQKSSSVEYSAGISNTKLTDYSQSFQTLPRNQRALGLHFKAVVLYWKVTSNNFLLLQEANNFLQKQLNPLKSPMIYRDTDIFLILIDSDEGSKEFCSQISELSFISNIRLKTINCYYNLNKNKSLWSYETPPSPYQNFYGRLLRAATTWRIRAYVEFEIPKDGNSKIIRGVYGKVVNVVAAKLNFTYKTFIASGDGSTGKKDENGTWVGVAGDVSNDLADIGFPVGLTPGRYEIVDLSATFTNEIITFISGPRQKIFTWKSLFWPLGIHVWLGMLLSLVASIILISFIIRFTRNVQFSNSSNELQDFLKSSWGTLRSSAYFTMSFLEQGATLPPSLPPSIKIHVICWLLFALVTTTAYKSKMVGFLTFPVYEVLPKDFEELAYSDYNLDYQFTGGAGYNLFKASNSPVYMNIVKKMKVQFDPINCFDHVLYIPKTICIVMIFIIDDMTHRNYSNKFGKHPFTVSSSHSFTFSAGIATQLRSPFASNINKLIDSATETGLISLWYKENLKNLQDSRIQWEKETGTKNKYEVFLDGSNESEHEQFNLNHLKGPIVVMICGVMISLGAFLYEKITHKKQRKSFREHTHHMIGFYQNQRRDVYWKSKGIFTRKLIQQHHTAIPVIVNVQEA